MDTQADLSLRWASISKGTLSHVASLIRKKKALWKLKGKVSQTSTVTSAKRGETEANILLQNLCKSVEWFGRYGLLYISQ